VEGLLNDSRLSNKVAGGSLAIFRLAPQDYHRFHLPIGGVLVLYYYYYPPSIYQPQISILTNTNTLFIQGPNQHIPGTYYTVNPVAVGTADVNVYGENKRIITEIISKDFGTVGK